MGWGTKPVAARAAAPKPARVKVTPPAPPPPPAPAPRRKRVEKLPVEEVGEVEEASPQRPDAKAQMEWHRLKSKKGWTIESEAMLLYEFIQQKTLFEDLVKFARKR